MTNNVEHFLYAVLEDNVVVNVVLGEDDQAGPILSAMLPDKTVIRVTEETGMAVIGGTFVNNIFRTVSPYQSWIWSDESKTWNAPVPRPQGPVFWSETALAWLPLPPA